MKIFGTAMKLVLITGAGVIACAGGVGDGAGLGDGNKAGAGGAGGSGAGTGTGASGGTIITTGGTGATAGTGSGGTAGECPKIEQTAELKPPLLHLVEDTSGSMNQDAPGGMGTKWEVTRDALKIAVGQMPPTMSLGLSFYPNTDNGGGGSGGAGSCINNVVAAPVQLLDDPHKATINAALDAQVCADGTPTHDAFDFGVTTLQAVAVDGSKFIVLITDGEPTYAQNCNGNGSDPVDNGPLITAVGTANTGLAIRTFVIGSPGSENARADLSAMARAGGTGPAGCSDTGTPEYCHFDMTTQTDLGQALVDALNEITGQALGCSFTIPDPPAGTTLNLNKVNVWYLPGGVEPGNLIPRDGLGTDCINGWQYSVDKTQILLCGTTCEAVKADPKAVIRITFGCDTIVT